MSAADDRAIGLQPDPAVGADLPKPYQSSRELLADQVRAVRLRLEAVKRCSPHAQRKLFEPLSVAGEKVPLDPLEPIDWPPELYKLEAEIERRLAASDSFSDVPMGRLRLHFRLTSTEDRILWLLIAHELDEISRALIRAVNTEQLADPTGHVLRRVVYEFGAAESCIELSEAGPLRRLALIERTDAEEMSAPFARQTWRASDRLIALAHGVTSLDSKLAHLEPKLDPMIAEDLEVADGALDLIRSACAVDDGVVIVSGPTGYGRRSCLVNALTGARRLLIVEGRLISKERDVATRELRALARECVLLGYTPLIRNLDALEASGEIADRLDLVESELPGLVVATATCSIARVWTRRAKNIELHPLSIEQRAKLWSDNLPALTPPVAEQYAGRYPIPPAVIHAVGSQVTTATGRSTDAEIKQALGDIVANRLGGLTTRVTVTQSWADVVLPEEQLSAISVLIARVKLRTVVNNKWGFARNPEAKGLGVTALFSGPPGTGKTMMAGIIARELGVDLYQVDISKIVSKWIGETDKNLAKIFDAADNGQAVLLFDEADSIFGKRTEVRSSNDRYANQEVNYLLTRIESFSGIVILTTNNETAIDPAFKRRLSKHVQFPMPEVEERRKLWRALLPEDSPTAGPLPFDKLAHHFLMSGGHIRNALVNAAYLAALDDKPIDASHLIEAARQEYDAMGKIPPRL